MASISVFDDTRVEYSYKQPSVVTITVDVQTGRERSPTPQGGQEWRLPTFDPRNETKYLYKLHTVDIYFWTKEDAISFVNSVRRILPSNQLNMIGEPAAPPPHSEAMSPIVQKLENVAISDPSYQQGRSRDSKVSSTFPGPPPAPVKPEEPATNFSPMAYNPAAPAAPETIRHREKTPPPPEDGTANPLAMAAVNDQGQQFSNGYQQQLGSVPSAIASPQGSYFPGPPQSAANNYNQTPGSFPPPPPKSSPGNYQQATYTPQQANFTTQYAQQNPQVGTFPGSPGFQQPLQSPGFQQPLQSPGFQQPLQSPGFLQPLRSPGFASPTQYPGSIPPPPPGIQAPASGFSNYSYSQNQGVPLANDYSIHQQLYRPTEGEAITKQKNLKEPRGKLEENAARLEKGVTGFLKKIEKKYG